MHARHADRRSALKMVPSLSNLLQASAGPDDYLGKIEKTPKAYEWRASIESYSPDPIIVEAVSKIKEKATLVCFSAYWCKDCLEHVPILVRTASSPAESWKQKPETRDARLRSEQEDG